MCVCVRVAVVVVGDSTRTTKFKRATGTQEPPSTPSKGEVQDTPSYRVSHAPRVVTPSHPGSASPRPRLSNARTHAHTQTIH